MAANRPRVARISIVATAGYVIPELKIMSPMIKRTSAPIAIIIGSDIPQIL
jgi:hypothetical protein